MAWLSTDEGTEAPVAFDTEEEEPMLAAAERSESPARGPLLTTTSVPAWRRGRIAVAAAGLVALGLALVAVASESGAVVLPFLRADGASVMGAAEAAGTLERIEAQKHRMNCSHFPYLRLLEKTNSNLGGLGPDTDAPPGLVYKGRVDGGGNNGEEFELHLNVSNDSAYFKPQSVKEIGFQGRYGSINIKSNSQVTLELRKYDPREKKNVPFEHFYFTFFDLDQGHNGTAIESITVSHHARAWLSKHSEVKATRQMDGSMKFEATQYGTGEDNPKDPLKLTRQQFNRAVTVLAQNVTKLVVTLAVSDSQEDDPRWFNFRGQPTLLCAQKTNGAHVDLQELPGWSGASGLRTGARAVLLAMPLLSLAW